MKRAYKGQISLVMLFLVAVAFILYAVSYNWAQIALAKTQVTLASNNGAATFASMLGSYGRYLKEDKLGGANEKCEMSTSMTSIATLIFTLIIYAAILAVSAVVTAGVGAAAIAGPLFNALVLPALIITGLTLIAQLAFVEPYLTKLWNMMQQSAEPQDQFLEQGLGGMLQATVGDTVRVADRWDLDMDGRWHDPVPPRMGVEKDKISRYSYYYTVRQNIKPPDIPNFVGSLKHLLRFIEYDLGIYPGQVAVDNKIYTFLGEDDLQAIHPGNPPVTVDATTYTYQGRDSKGQLFDLFWLLKDSAIKVADFTSITAPLSSAPECHWYSGCTPNLTNLFRPRAPYMQGTDTAAFAPLVLPNCTGGDCWISQFEDSTGNIDSRRIDRVSFFSFEPIPDNTCPSLAVDPLWWKPGLDKASPVFGAGYPIKFYGSNCGSDSEASSDPCKCDVIFHKEWWRDDIVDRAKDSLSALAVLAAPIIATRNETEEKAWASSVKSWGPPLKNLLLNIYPLDFFPTIAGLFHKIFEKIDHFNSGIIVGYGQQFPGMYAQPDTWCLPPVTDQGLIGYAEQQYILGGGSWGSLESVIRCLEYEGGAVSGVQNNAQRFDACYNAIEDDVPYDDPALVGTGACAYLPRSLVVGFDPDYRINNPPQEPAPDEADFPENYDYRAKILQSRDLAQNQVIKFRKRAKYLRSMQSRANALKSKIQQVLVPIAAPCYSTSSTIDDEAVNAIGSSGMCQPANQNCCASFAGPQLVAASRVKNAVKYIEQMMATLEAKKTVYGNEIIYGWFSEVPKSGPVHDFGGGGKLTGYLHLVKVQGSLPTRRGNPPIAGLPLPGPGVEEKIPNIHTWAEWVWHGLSDTGLKRCYKINDGDGSVGARVIRYDEEKNNPVSFISGLPLWQLMFNNPHGGALPNVNDLYQKCFTTHYRMTATPSSSDEDATVTYQYEVDDEVDGLLPADLDGNVLKQAFILSPPYDSLPFTKDARYDRVMACKRVADAFLAHGMVSQTCAYYSSTANKLYFQDCP